MSGEALLHSSDGLLGAVVEWFFSDGRPPCEFDFPSSLLEQRSEEDALPLAMTQEHHHTQGEHRREPHHGASYPLRVQPNAEAAVGLRQMAVAAVGTSPAPNVSVISNGEVVRSLVPI